MVISDSLAISNILIRPSTDNAPRVWRALIRFGAPLSDINESDFTRTDVVYQMGRPPGRIDILTDVSGLTFDDAWSQRVAHTLSGVEVFALGLDHLAKNKRATGRPKDLADLAWLEREIERQKNG